jgi:hypothetical protein
MEEADALATATLRSGCAYVASTRVACENCGRRIEVVCVYCESGVVDAEPLERFTAQQIRAVDPDLALQLRRWPRFRFDERYGCYLNHCGSCGAAQDEDALHGEPDRPFFDVPGAAGRAVRLSALAGTITLVADYSADV